ncbi:MAG: hypothetical protein ACJAZO_001048 [Myxococcota bacterium]
MTGSRSLNWKTFVVIGGSLLLFGGFVYSLEWDKVWEALSRVHPIWVLVAAACVILDYYSRAMRWGVVIHHFDPLAPARVLWRGMTIGNALNTVLPLRAGDLIRPMFLSAKRRLPLATVLSTVVVERLLDAFGVVGCLAVILILMDTSGSTAAGAMDQIREWGLPASVTAMGLLIAVLLMASRRARFIAKAGLSWFGRPWRVRGYRIYLQLVEGLQPARSPGRLLGGLAWTAVVWVLTTLSILAVTHSLDISLPPAGALFAAVALTVAISLPQAPGFLGIFQVAMTESLVLWGASRGESQAAALVLWAVYVLPITGIGMFHAWLEASELTAIRASMAEKAKRDGP